MPTLTDRVVLVTGAGSGIGKAIAERLARDGAAVVVAGRDEKKLLAVVNGISASGGIAVEAAGDVRNEKDATRMCETAVGAFGRLDTLVHCAGDVVRGPKVDATSREQWDQMFDVHVRALYWLARAGVPEMRRCGEGCVLNVASNLAFLAIPGLAAYSAAKGAVASLTRAMAVDLGPEGIRVNAVAPGLVETPATTTLGNFAEKKGNYAARAPLRRIGVPDDVAGAASFLISKDAAWITGQTLIVDGGYCIA
jgi:NAD(P)-dependent dehydrogenase (short-subunit alcohol dehydrogenase family)